MSRSFDQVAAVYDRTRQIPEAAATALAAGIAAQTALTPATTLLEVGVGTGRIALPIIQRGCRYTGLDLSDPMLRTAQAKSHAAALPLHLVRGDATNLPFPTATFDVGLVVHLFHLIPNWQRALDEMLRVIRPYGQFLYGYESYTPDPAQDALAQQWRSLLAQHGLTPQNHRTPNNAVAATLQGYDPQCSTTTIATWPQTTSVRQILDRYANRAYSSNCNIPEPAFQQINASIQTWAQEHLANFDQPLTATARFTILAATRHE